MQLNKLQDIHKNSGFKGENNKLLSNLVYKQTKAVVVLKDLKSAPYMLFAETDNGLIEVAPSEANTHKKLHVSWNKNK